MRALVAELESAQTDIKLVAAIPSDLSQSNINLAAGLRITPGEVASEHLTWDWLPDSARRSGTGLVFVGNVMGIDILPLMAIAPPFPIAEASRTMDIAALLGIVNTPATVAVVDLHLGRARIGIARDARLVSSQTVSRYIRGRHRAGGQSANRFRRNRQEWQRKFGSKLASEVEQMASESQPALEWLAIAGDRNTARRWLADSKLLERIGIQLLPRSFDSRADDRSALETLAREVWSCRVFEPAAS